LLSSIESPVFVHDLQNPPTEDRSCNFEITVVNSKQRIVLEKQDVGLQTRYLLKVQDVMSLGLASVDQRGMENVIKDLVLASNLSLQRACVSTMKGDLFRPEIQIKVPEAPVRVEHTPEGVHVFITETMIARDSIHVTIGTKEELDEEQTISNLRLLRKLNRHAISTTTTTPVTSLSKALSEFESAMTVFPRLMIFKHLFNSLELSTNWDGANRTGDSLDNEVAKIPGIGVTEVEKWRNFYNRTKHVNRTPKDVTEFVGGLENLSETLMPVRRASTSMITDRLRKLP